MLFSLAAAFAGFLAGLALCAVPLRNARRAGARATKQRRQFETLARALLSASRERPETVLQALDAAARALEPELDAVLCFEHEHDALTCVYASGVRAAPYRTARFALADRANPVVAAWHAGHRIERGPDHPAVMPRDRAVLAVPLRERDHNVGVLYFSSSRAARFAARDVLATLAGLAAPAYRLATERRTDREHATTDGLTGLLTPRAFRTALAQRCNGARDERLALLFIDTDHFKACNDRFGHAAGDAVLRAIADVLRGFAGVGAIAGRNGGDEFCLLFPVFGKSDAIGRAEHVRAAIERFPFADLLGAAPAEPISTSIGVAMYPDDATSIEQLLEQADAAMYRSKRDGRNRVSYVRPPHAPV